MTEETGDVAKKAAEDFTLNMDFNTGMWIIGGVVLLIVGGVIGACIHRAATGKRAKGRPIYWNLIVFALIAAVFSIFAMLMVSNDHRDGIALLYLGMIGGYAASIKELDLAKFELEKLKLRKGVPLEEEESEDSVNKSDNQPESGKSEQQKQS